MDTKAKNRKCFFCTFIMFNGFFFRTTDNRNYQSNLMFLYKKRDFFLFSFSLFVSKIILFFLVWILFFFFCSTISVWIPIPLLNEQMNIYLSARIPSAMKWNALVHFISFFLVFFLFVNDVLQPKRAFELSFFFLFLSLVLFLALLILVRITSFFFLCVYILRLFCRCQFILFFYSVIKDELF